jgi:hypothetical protein
LEGRRTIVVGAVAPDKYIVSDGKIVEIVINETTVIETKDPETGKSKRTTGPDGHTGRTGAIRRGSYSADRTRRRPFGIFRQTTGHRVDNGRQRDLFAADAAEYDDLRVGVRSKYRTDRGSPRRGVGRLLQNCPRRDLSHAGSGGRIVIS